MHASIFSTRGLEFFPELFLLQQNGCPFGNLVLQSSATHAFGNLARLLDRSDSNAEIWLGHLGRPATQSVFHAVLTFQWIPRPVGFVCRRN